MQSPLLEHLKYLVFETNFMTWLGICFCMTQSALFSGLNLAVFSITRLQLEVDASAGNEDAIKVLKMRHDSNFLLTTILWGNVAINVLLAILSNSILTGLGAFLFSTVVITLFGEILPQAYFSRNALRMAALLIPVLKFYQIVMFPVAKSTALLLDWWLGKEEANYFKERIFRTLIRKHIESSDADIDHTEGLGALNFLAIDDIFVSQEGEPVAHDSIIKLPLKGNFPVFPKFENSPDDPFLKAIHSSGKKWVIITDMSGNPVVVLDADGFLRDALFERGVSYPYLFCHRPIIVKNSKSKLGDIISRLKVKPETIKDDVIDEDIILFWGATKRVITGADILGRLLRGISRIENTRT